MLTNLFFPGWLISYLLPFSLFLFLPFMGSHSLQVKISKKQKTKIRSETVNFSTHWLQDALYSIWFSSIVHCLEFFRRSMFKMSLTIWKFVLIQFSLNIYGAHSVPVCAYESFPSINMCILSFVFSESLTTFITSVFSEVITNNLLLKLQSEIRGLYTASQSKDQPCLFLTVSGFYSVF